MPTQHTPPYTILIVDDNAVDRLLYKGLLARSPGTYNLIEAEVGEDGLTLYHQHNPACVLLDYHLPDLDGIEFLDALQAEEKQALTPRPIIMLTGDGSESVAVAAMKRGAQDYLLKGQVTFESLHRAIQNTIEKMALHKQVKTQQQSLKEFAQSAAHDLKSPLAQISNFCQLLQMRYSDRLEERGQMYLSEILSGTRSMNALIEALLTYARAGHPTSPFAELPLAPLVAEARDRLATSFAESGAALELEEPLSPLFGDEIQLIRLLQNLLSNAIKFSGEKTPHITVSTQESPHAVSLIVQDQGIGIAPHELETIFEPLTRAARVKDLPGHGIGLASCRKIADQHNGSLSVTSSPGEGSKFILQIPRQQSTQQPNNPRHSAQRV